jgi:hypothetical protein
MDKWRSQNVKIGFCWITAIFQKKVGWKSAILNLTAISRKNPQLCSMKVEVWIVLQKVEEIFEISQFLKLWDKKISFKAYSNISASFDFFTKIPTDLSLEPKNLWETVFSPTWTAHGMTIDPRLIVLSNGLHEFVDLPTRTELSSDHLPVLFTV